MPNMKIRLLCVVWVCFLLRGLFYSVLFPIWEGYDEHAHFAFIQHLIYPGGLPRMNAPVSREIQESLKLVPVPWEIRNWSRDFVPHDDYWKLPDGERERRQRALTLLSPELSREAGQNPIYIYEAKQPPLYYWMFSLPMRLADNLMLPSRVLLLRVLAVLLTSVFVPLGFRIAVFVMKDEDLALMVVALAAAMPEFVIEVARVGNECLGVAVYCLILYFALRFAAEPERARIAAMLGLSLGLGLLTKSYFLTAAIAVGAILIVAVFSRGKRIISSAFVLFVVPLATSGWWYWRNRALGEWSGAALSDLLRNIKAVEWIPSIDTILLSHIWFGNWSFLGVRSWMYHLMGAFFLAGFAGFLVLVARWRLKQSPPVFLRDWRNVGVVSAFYISYVMGLLYFALVTYTYTGVSGIPGWYMYCLVIAEVILLASGLFALSPPRWMRWTIPALTTLFCLLDLYATHFILIPYYTGLIAHKQNGVLPAFHVERFGEFGTALQRLQINRATSITSLSILILWVLYLIATVALVFVNFKSAQNFAAPDRKSDAVFQSLRAASKGNGS
jgi:hypothetical protein